jgi:hypothetical protein
MTRMDQALITATVDGVPLGVFDKRTGGDTDSEESKYRPGGLGMQVALGGKTIITNVIIDRLYDLERDHELARRLRTRVGVALASVSEQPLDRDRNPWGRPIVWHGILKMVQTPERDSETNGPALFHIEISTEGNVS